MMYCMKVFLHSAHSTPDSFLYFPSGLSAHTHVELPYYSKFLLIAAYLASFNPARTDKRFFVKVQQFYIINIGILYRL